MAYAFGTGKKEYTLTHGLAQEKTKQVSALAGGIALRSCDMKKNPQGFCGDFHELFIGIVGGRQVAAPRWKMVFVLSV